MRAVKAVGFLGALAALMLAGCGDGSIKSPDFESATTLESIVVQPAFVGHPNTLQARPTLSYRAIETFSETVQPGPTDSARPEINKRTPNKDITADTAWPTRQERDGTNAKRPCEAREGTEGVHD